MDKQQEFVLRALEERDVRFVRLWFTDVLGFLKSVAVAPAERARSIASSTRPVLPVMSPTRRSIWASATRTIAKA